MLCVDVQLKTSELHPGDGINVEVEVLKSREAARYSTVHNTKSLFSSKFCFCQCKINFLNLIIVDYKVRQSIRSIIIEEDDSIM